MAPASEPRPTATAADNVQVPAAPRRGVVAVAWTNFTENFFSTVFVGIIVGVAMFGLGVVNDNIIDEFAEIDARFAAVDARLNRLEDAIDARFAAVDARFAAVDARFNRLEENQLEMALTLARLVALLEGRGDAGSMRGVLR